MYSIFLTGFDIFTMVIMGVVTLVVSKTLFKSYLSPLGTYGFIWALVLSLFFIRIIKYPALGTEAAIAIFGSFLSFVTGSILAISKIRDNTTASRRQTVDPEAFRDEYLQFRRRLKILVLVLSLISLAGALKLLLDVYGIYGMAGITGNKTMTSRYALMDGATSVSTVWGAMFSFVFPAGALAGFMLSLREWKNVTLYIPLLAAIVWSFAYSGRSSLLIVGITYFAGYFLGTKVGWRRRSYNVRKLVYVAVLLVIFFLISSYIYSNRGGVSYSALQESQYANYSVDPLTFAYYKYLTGPIAAFNYYVQHFDGQYSFGTSIFYPVFHQVEKLGLINLPFKQGIYMQAVAVPLNINIFTYLRAMYTDFGLAGVFIFPFLIGFITSRLYIGLLSRPSVNRLILLAFFYVLIVTSPYEYMLFQSSTWFAILVVMFLVMLMQKKIRVSFR